MGIPGIEQARNNSLYSDSPRPVYSKHGTVTDVLTVTVRGSTNTALYTNLHYLVKLGEYARIGTQNPYVKATPYLEFKPGGSSAGEVLYAPIYDCRVEMPADWAGVQDATKTIEDVTVTIERGLWQGYAPGLISFTENVGVLDYACASSSASAVDVGGDTAALYTLRVFQSSGSTTINRVIVGYRSQALGGANYASLGKKEAESQTNGTDTSDQVDATASGGNCVRCTFGTTTIATRLSGSGIPYGTHRIFARMKITGDIVATVNAKYQDTSASGAVYVANDSVSVSSTSWLVYDLGVARYYESGIGAIYSTTATGIWAIDALRASGTSGNLDIDWVYFMPTEGYLTASGFTMLYDVSISDILWFNNATYPGMNVQISKSSTFSRVSSLQHTASLAPLPGPCAVYWIAGTDTGSVFDSGITATTAVVLETNPRFLMPSEV
jgi:hypothetical protein